MNEKVWKIGCLWILVSSLTMTNVANATCTPTPDCSTMGYTENSCEGDSLKCPFDTTKLYCITCDSSFKYNCNNENTISGIGKTCNNKYVTCKCIVGASLINGECICDNSCSVGNIYYSDGSCSSCVDNNKTAIGIVIKENELVMSRKSAYQMYWANNTLDVSDAVNHTMDSVLSDYKGKENTLAIVSTYIDDTVENNAAVYCNSYSTSGTSVGDWYLPAYGELYDYMFKNTDKINIGLSNLGWPKLGDWYWSSSEIAAKYAFYIRSSGGTIATYYKLSNLSVVCFLQI